MIGILPASGKSERLKSWVGTIIIFLIKDQGQRNSLTVMGNKGFYNSFLLNWNSLIFL